MLEETWSRLDDNEQELLRQLAAFPGVFSLGQIETTAGRSATRTLAALVDRSLVAPSADRTTYRLLETVKLFARRTWTETSRPDSYLDRHADALLEQIDRWSDDNRYMQLASAGWHTKHFDDLLAADDHLLATNRLADAARLWASGATAWHITTPTIALSVLDRLDRLVEGNHLSPGIRARAELAAACAAMAARDPQRLVTSAETAVAAAQEAGPSADVVRAFALNVQSWMTMVKDLDHATELLETSEVVATAADAPLVALAARGYAAVARAIHGDLSAGELVDDIESAADTEGTYVWNTTRSLAITCGLFDRPLHAGSQMAVQVKSQEAHGIPIAGITYLLLGLPEARAGHASATHEALEVAERELRRSGNDDGLPDLLLGPAILAYALGQPERAARWTTAIRLSAKPTQNLPMTSFFRQLRDRVGLTDDTTGLGDTQAVYAEARAWVHEVALAERAPASPATPNAPAHGPT